MATDKQIAAARRNGALSRGPRTPEGKARAIRVPDRNRQLAGALLLEGESRELFDELLRLLNSALNPRTPIDELLIGKMAAAHWRQIRLWNLERQGNQSLGDQEMRLDRQFFRTLDRYLRLQLFFGPPNPLTPALPIQNAVSQSNSEPEPTQPEPDL